MLDIDRLHKCLEGPSPRRFGKSYSNLVLALHEADFSNERVITTAYNKQWAQELAKMAYRIAQDMEFEEISFIRPDTLIINNTKFQFVVRNPIKENGGSLSDST